MEPRHLEPYGRLSPSLLREELSKKSVLVTGGGYGIGTAIAKSFAEAGVGQVILVGRTLSRLKNAAGELSSFRGLDILLFQVDISSHDDVKKLFESLTRSPDILVNNAGFMASPARFIDADLVDYWRAFEINVYGTALVTQSYLQHRRSLHGSAKLPAVVITLNTIGAYSVRVPTLSSYGASKAALSRWSELVSEDIPESIARFISVHPGAIKTDMGTKSGLDGVFPSTNPQLAGDFIAWLSTKNASFLSGRFAWVNWDIDELTAKRDEIVTKDLLRTALAA